MTLLFVGYSRILFFYQVLEIDQERKRFLVTLNPSQVKIGNSEDLRKAVTGPSLLKSLIEEREEILKEISKLPGMEM